MSNPDLCVNVTMTKGQVNAKSVEVLAGLPVRISELRGHVIAVVEIGQDGSIASFSNRCGIAAPWCLAAPASRIRTAYFGRHPDTNNPGSQGAYSPSGTSFAAPMVTGALVVMKDYFRNQLPNTELVSRMLATAGREGIYADSSVYGRGLLDLAAATSPVGTTSAPFGNAVDGPGSPMAQTRFVLGGAFGDGLVDALAGQEIAAFDERGTPFWYRLGGFARAAPGPSAMARLGTFLAPNAWGHPAAEIAPPLLGGFAPMERDAGGSGPRLGFLEAPSWPNPGGGHLALAGPTLAFNAKGPGGFGFTAFSTEGQRGRAPVSGALLSWRPSELRFGPPLELVGGWLGERKSLLGSRTAGAFGRLAAASAFVGIEGGARLGAWRLEAGAEFGMAHGTARGGMIENLSPLYSSAFALRAARPLDGRSSVQVSLAQPLRVESGRTKLSVPVGRTQDGRVLRRGLSADLAPTGRQTNLALQWQRRLAGGGNLRLGATWTRNPGHDAAAPAGLTLLAGWQVRY